MNQQQGRQDAAARHHGPQAPIGAAHEEFASAHSIVEKLLGYICRAVDTNMVVSKLQAVLELGESFTLVARNAREQLPQPEFCKLLNLHARAAANASALIVQDTQGTYGLVLDEGAGDVVGRLFKNVALLIRSESQDKVADDDGRELVWSAVDSSGLLPVLQRLTQAVQPTLQQLIAAAPQTQQKHTRKARQQQQLLLSTQKQHILRCCVAAELVDDLLAVWECLLQPTSSWWTTSEALVTALPAVIGLAGSAWPSLATIFDSCVKDSVNTLTVVERTAVAAFTAALLSIPGSGLAAAAGAANTIHSGAGFCSRLPPLQSTECCIPTLDQLRAVLLADKLQELLLQLLAYQVSALHAAHKGRSATLRKCTLLADAAAYRSDRTWEGHEKLPDPNSYIVPAHHTSLVHAVGLGFPGHSNQESSVPGAAKKSVAVTVKALREVILQRATAAQSQSSSGSSSGSSGSSSCSINASNQQGQQQTAQQQPGVLQQHLVAPAVKVLIEIMLLLPSGDVALQAQIAELIMLLLHAGYAQGAAAAAPATGPWPELPAAVAAGLLQPVVSQLARAVICCLLQTEPKQQQQQQHDCHQQQQHCHQQQQQDSQRQPQQQKAQTGLSLQQDRQQVMLEQDGQQQQQQEQQQELGFSKLEGARLALLHHYGSLLITVCQSVEPKHIAAALLSANRADPIVSLVAMEAVIRAQACHLIPAVWKQQQQQGCLSHSSKFLLGLVCRPLNQAPLLLLPFVRDVIEAVMMFAMPENLEERQNDIDHVGASLYIFKLAVTALKVSQLATAAAEQQSALAADSVAIDCSTPDSDVAAAAVYVERESAVACQCTEIVTVVCDIAAIRCSSVQGSEASHRGASGVKSNVGMFPLVLLGRAAHTWGNMSQALISAGVTETDAARHSAVVWARNVCSLIMDPALAALKAAAAAVEACDGSQQTQQQQHRGSWPGIERLKELIQYLVSLQQRLQEFLSVGTPLADERLCTTAAAATAASASETVVGVPTTLSGDQGPQGPQAPNGKAVLEMLQVLTQHLQQFSPAVLAEFPVQYCCNNPACLNLSKLSEYQLVCGKGCICAGCEVARYCSRECQRQHWQQHKPVCRRLRPSSCSGQD